MGRGLWAKFPIPVPSPQMTAPPQARGPGPSPADHREPDLSPLPTSPLTPKD